MDNKYSSPADSWEIGQQSSSGTNAKFKDVIEKDFIVFGSDSDSDNSEDYERLLPSKVELHEQLTTNIESIVNNNDRMGYLVKLYNLLLLSGTILDDDQLENTLKIIACGVAYDNYKQITGIELELHLRIYALLLEIYGRRPLKMARKFYESLYENLVQLHDTHLSYTKVLENGLKDVFANLEEGFKVQNYNIDFLLLHLYDTLHMMDDDKTTWLEIIKQLKVLFSAHIKPFTLPSMTGVMATVETPIDNKATIEVYNKIHKTLQSKFSVGHWYKEWIYLFSIYQAFVEWSAVPIHKNLVAKGELMIIKDLWRFGDQEWNKAVSAQPETDGYKIIKPKIMLDYISESVPYSLLFGILDIAQNLINSTKNINTLAHCYYLAKLSMDIIRVEFIQFKAMEVLLTLYKKDPITFSVVQVDLDQQTENFSTLNQDKKRFQDMKEHIDKKYTYINQAHVRMMFKMSVSRQKEKKPDWTPEKLLNSNSDDLLILDMVADHLTCPFTQKVTDDFRILPCKHKISYLALEIFMRMNCLELKCFYCRRKCQLDETEKMPSSPIYKALYEKFVRAGHITPKDKVKAKDFTTIVASQDDNDDVEESSIIKSKFLYLLKMKPKKTIIQRMKRPKNLHPTYRQGKKALDEKRYKDAILWFERALIHYPNSTTIQIDLAIAYMENLDYQKCYDCITQAIKNNPNNARAWAQRGKYYMQQSEYKQALKDLKQSLEIDANDALALKVRGNVYYLLNQYDMALDDFNQLLDIEPNNTMALEIRGKIYAMLDEYSNAIRDFNKLLEIEPKNANALIARGVVYFNLCQYEYTLKDLNKLLQIKSTDTNAQQLRGHAYLMLEQYDNALYDLDESLGMDPSNIFTLKEKDVIRCDVNQYDNALDNLNKLLITEPDNTIALRVRGKIYYALKQYDNALNDFNKSLETQPGNNVFTLSIRAAIYLDLCQYNKALDDISKVLKIKPNETLYRQLQSLFDQLDAQNYQNHNQCLLLEFKGHQIGNAGAIILAKILKLNFSLTSLVLQDNQIGDTGTTALAKALESNSFLVSLDLRKNQIGNTGATALAKALGSNSSLTSLNLQHNQIGYSGATALAKVLESKSSLISLNLLSNQIGAAGATALAKALESNSFLTSLVLQGNKIVATGATALAKALESNSSLISLDLQGNKIGATGATALAKALESNSSLTSLDLQANQIGNTGATALTKALESNSSLTSLNLQSNQIGDTGATALAKALNSNSSLISLALQGNKIGDTGVTALAKALESNSILTSLSLTFNQIGDTGATALAKALDIESNSSLTFLDLQYNQIGDTGAIALAKALESNSSLTFLDLQGNQIRDTGATSLSKALESNSSLTYLNLW